MVNLGFFLGKNRTIKERKDRERAQRSKNNRSRSKPCPSFPCFFGKRPGKPPKKTRIFYPNRPPEIPGKERKNAQKNKEFLAEEKSKEFQKSKERKDREFSISIKIFDRARKRNPNPNFLVRIFSSGVGVFHVNGWGPKSSICPSKSGKSQFLGGISRDFAGISRGCPKSLRKKGLCSISVP